MKLYESITKNLKEAENWEEILKSGKVIQVSNDLGWKYSAKFKLVDGVPYFKSPEFTGNTWNKHPNDKSVEDIVRFLNANPDLKVEVVEDIDEEPKQEESKQKEPRGKILREPDMERAKGNVREWYMKEYPTDELGPEIKEDATFEDVFEALDRHEDFYDFIGVGDSIVRERIFEELADIMGTDYDYVYYQWLGESENLKEGISYKPRENDYKPSGDEFDFETTDSYYNRLQTLENLSIVKDGYVIESHGGGVSDDMDIHWSIEKYDARKKNSKFKGNGNVAYHVFEIRFSPKDLAEMSDKEFNDMLNNVTAKLTSVLDNYIAIQTKKKRSLKEPKDFKAQDYYDHLYKGKPGYVDKQCPICKRTFAIHLDNATLYNKYRDGYGKIQDLFPNLNPMEREFIKTGYCPDCQKELFGTDYTSDDIGLISESQTQEIKQTIEDIKLKEPDIDKYLNEYYKEIEKLEPKPAYDKEKDQMNPLWEQWNRDYNNVLYSETAWNNFANWIKDKYGKDINANLNESAKKDVKDDEIYDAFAKTYYNHWEEDDHNHKWTKKEMKDYILTEQKLYPDTKMSLEDLDALLNFQHELYKMDQKDAKEDMNESEEESMEDEEKKYDGLFGRVLEIIESNGWSCDVNEDDCEVGIENWSPAGEDLYEYLSYGSNDMSDTEKGENLQNSVRELAENFDEDEHVEMLVDMRGQRGVPSSVRELVEDAHDIQGMYNDLWKEVSSISVVKDEEPKNESEEPDMRSYFHGDDFLDNIGSDYELIVALYDALGYDTNEEFFPEKVQEDADNENLYMEDGNIVLDKNGYHLVCYGRDSANYPIIANINGILDSEKPKSIWLYISESGLGVNTIPNDIEAQYVTNLASKTVFSANRKLTLEEMEKFNLKSFDNRYFNQYPEVIKELSSLK